MSNRVISCFVLMFWWVWYTIAFHCIDQRRFTTSENNIGFAVLNGDNIEQSRTSQNNIGQHCCPIIFVITYLRGRFIL